MSQQKPDDYVEVELELDELDVTSAEGNSGVCAERTWAEGF